MKENEIGFFEMLGISEHELSEYSVRLNGNLGDYEVLDLYYNHHDELLEHIHTVKWNDGDRRNISTKYVLQFVQLKRGNKSQWLFVGCSEILPGETDSNRGKQEKIANYRVLKEYSPYEARVVVNYTRPQGLSGAGALTRNASKADIRKHLWENMNVYRVAPSPISAMPFPGYENVRLSHPQLVAALKNEDWRAALDSVSAIYLQTDMSNGWHYVGSAYSRKGSEQGLLSRWQDYAGEDPGGGNDLLEKLSPEYIKKNFQYSILEIFDRRAKQNDIIQREHWWMNTLGSVYTDEAPFGYNSSAERSPKDDKK